MVEQLPFIELARYCKDVAFNLVGQQSTGVRKMAPQFGVNHGQPSAPSIIIRRRARF